MAAVHDVTGETQKTLVTPELVRRGESVVGLIISVWLLAVHRRAVNWPVFAALFAYIDLVGYIPGLVRVHATKNPHIENHYYLAYNTTHTFVTAIPIAALAVYRDPGRRWTALAVFIHLFGDRGLLGNFSKAPDGEFEHLAADA